MSRRRGVTLIEAMVVVLIVVVLMMVLWPVHGGGSKRSARDTVCLSNVKQMSTAILLYEADHHDRFPPAARWMSLTQPYVKNIALTQCPSLEPSPSSTEHGYAFNRNLSLEKANALKAPDKVVVLYDSTNLLRNANDPITSLPKPGRHGRETFRGNHVGYSDGHAKRVKDQP